MDAGRQLPGALRKLNARHAAHADICNQQIHRVFAQKLQSLFSACCCSLHLEACGKLIDNVPHKTQGWHLIIDNQHAIHVGSSMNCVCLLYYIIKARQYSKVQLFWVSCAGISCCHYLYKSAFELKRAIVIMSGLCADYSISREMNETVVGKR